ncbi:MAG: MFS transporter, partial [Haloferacaceae archaeon]
EYAPFAVLAVVWFLAKFGRALLPPLFPEFQTMFDIGSAETGLLFSALMATYGLMQFPSGVLADRAGSDRVIAAGLVVTAGAAVLFVVAPSYAVLLVAAAAFGLGTGVHKTVAMKALSVIYPARRGGALGAFDTVGFLGSAVAPLVLVVLGALALDWRVAFGLAAVAGLAFVGLNRLYVKPALALRAARGNGDDAREADDAATDDERGAPDAPSVAADGDADDTPAAADGDGAGDGTADGNGEAAADDADASTRPDGSGDGGATADDPDSDWGLAQYAREFRRPLVAAFVGAVVLYSTVWNAVAAFLPLFLIQVKGFSAATANLLYSGFMVLGLVQAPAGGITDRVGEVPVLVGSYLVALLGIVALLETGSLLAVAVTGGAFGLAMHGVRPARGSYLLRVFPDETGGGGLGLVRSLMVLVGSATTAIVGAVADAVGLGTAFAGVAGLTALAVVLIVVVAALDRRAGGAEADRRAAEHNQ